MAAQEAEDHKLSVINIGKAKILRNIGIIKISVNVIS